MATFGAHQAPQGQQILLITPRESHYLTVEVSGSKYHSLRGLCSQCRNLKYGVIGPSLGLSGYRHEAPRYVSQKLSFRHAHEGWMPSANTCVLCYWVPALLSLEKMAA